MKEIETQLHGLHARSSGNTECSMEVNGEHNVVSHVAFARIDHVDNGSPAAAAVNWNYVN